MKLALAHGVFDLLHSGHIAHLQQCRSFGDHLYVSVVADRFVGKGRYLINDERERMFALSALKCVDKVILCEAPGPQEVLKKLQPTIYVRNDEYVAQTQPEYAVCKKLGIAVGFTRTVPPHTSEIIKRILILNSKGYSEERK